MEWTSLLQNGPSNNEQGEMAVFARLGLIWHIANLLCLGVQIMHKVMSMY